MKQKRPFTLIEIMVVIFLIGLIGSVIGYNMKGSLNKGRAFKTERAIEQLESLLNLELAKGTGTVEEIIADKEKYLKLAGHSKPQDLLKDGWGQPFTFDLDDNEEFVVTSDKWKKYKDKINEQNTKPKK